MGPPLVSLVSPELGSLGLSLEKGASQRRKEHHSDDLVRVPITNSKFGAQKLYKAKFGIIFVAARLHQLHQTTPKNLFPNDKNPMAHKILQKNYPPKYHLCNFRFIPSLCLGLGQRKFVICPQLSGFSMSGASLACKGKVESQLLDQHSAGQRGARSKFAI